MFCSNCGNEVNPNSKFCPHCGTVMESLSVTQQSVYQEQVQPKVAKPAENYQQSNVTSVEKKPEKKRDKKTIIISLVVALVVFLLARNVIAPMITNSYIDQDTSSGNTNATISQSTNNDENVSSSGEYEEIFLSRNIVDGSAFFLTANNASFAKVDANNNIDKRAFGYNDEDVIEEMVYTQYYCITGYTADEIANMDAGSRSMNSNLEALSFCEVTYHTGTDYYSVTATFSDLDDSNNFSQLKSIGIVGDGDYLSMSETEASLLSEGFVKK